MSNHSISNNDVNGAGTSSEGSSSGRCSPGEQRGPGRYPTTARMRWNKEVRERLSVSPWSFVMTRLTGEMTAITTARA